MADIAISIAGKVIEVLASEAIAKICSMWGYKDELEELSKTITTIKNVLIDAECKRDLSMVQQGYIAELKDAVYDADDLFDEFRTLVELNLISSDKGGKFLGKVRRFFSSKKEKISRAHRMSRRVEEIRGHLDAVANNYTKFGFSVDYKPIVRRREDTCSYVDVKDVIGRNKDKEIIIDMLMAPSGDDDGFCFVTIVGMGGLGKTALTQLVFNDEKIEKEFSSSRFWVCVSDQDGEQFNVRTILSKILEVVTKTMPDISSSMESIQNQFQEQFRGKKYLLVLDDVWNEERDNWVKLKKFLMMGARGSKIVVTSRSEKTGGIIGSNVYKLEGLSNEYSRRLFEMSAFEKGEKQPELVAIGENIVNKCCGIPLAIKVVGSLLYGQGKSKWQSIERSGLVDIDKGDNDKILAILKLSYHNLTPSLKSCFSYCAIFPKDFDMKKEVLIGLWLAQGYIVPLDGGQGVEDAAEEHFSILMRRCFFQDMKKDVHGNVESVKIHDLMHDVAQEVGKEEICVVISTTSKFGEKIRHVNIIGDEIKTIPLCSKIRTFICSEREEFMWDQQIENLTTLRVLDLSYLGIESVPKTIERLLLLRYLNLQNNSSLEVLPDAITRLYNLQTLILCDCRNLREVPKDFSKLINLRHLDFYGCDELNGMPSGILKLRNLSVLPYYETSNEISEEELKVLQQVFSKLEGKIYTEIFDEDEQLTKFSMDFFYGSWIIHEGVLEKLELPPYLKELGLSTYGGKTIPWPAISLPQYLLCIEITHCSKLERIPVLSNLPHLKSLKLRFLDSMEYMENGMCSISNDTNASAVAECFPSLESLVICYLPRWKGLWKEDSFEMRLRFPRLSNLRLEKCPSLTSFVPCSNLEHQLPSLCTLCIIECPNLASNLVCSSTLKKLELKETNERLAITGELGGLREMVVYDADHLKLLPPTNCLTSLNLIGDVRVDIAIQRVQSCASSLRTLTLNKCNKLFRLPRLGHFIALEKLILSWNDYLTIFEEDDGEPWKSMSQSLRHLVFSSLPKMKCLPKGMRHLTNLQTLQLDYFEKFEGGLPEWINCLSSLQSLTIYSCHGIKSLPEAIKDLSSLKVLSIDRCPDLERRCKRPNGEDYPKIQHIPKIDILFY